MIEEGRVNSFLAYMGGKSLLAKTIIPKFPEHRCYVEVFAGAAWLMFKKDESISKVEVINDINKDLVTLYRVVKCHLEEFVRYFKWCLVARDEFYRLRKEEPETLTDIQRSARFYYLLKAGFAAKIKSPTFSVSPSRTPRMNLLRIEEELSEVHLRLSHVYIENRPYQEIFKRLDRDDTFFYVDPPYYGYEDYYGADVFSRNDFETLRNILGSLKGKFALSINNVDPIRALFKNFRIEKVKTSYTAAGANKKKRVEELLITNYEPPPKSRI